MLDKELQLEFLGIIRDKIGGVLDRGYSKPMLSHLGRPGYNAWWIFFREYALYFKYRTEQGAIASGEQIIDLHNPKFLDVINELAQKAVSNYKE